MAWEDDEPEEETGPLAVANALAGNSEGAAPEAMPDVVARTQPASEPDNSETEMLRPVEAHAPEEQGPVGGVASGPDLDESSMMQGPDGGSGESVPGASGLRAPSLPSLPSYEDATSAHQQLEKDMQSVNPKDYRPSGWRRALAGFAAGTAAIGHVPNAIGIAESINNAPLNRARAAQAPKIAADQQALTDLAARNAQARQQYSDENTQFQNAERDMRNQGYVADQAARAEDFAARAASRRGAIVQFTPDDPQNPYGGGTGVTADGKTVKGVAPPDKWIQAWEKTPQGKQAAARLASQQKDEEAERVIADAEKNGTPFSPQEKRVMRSHGLLKQELPSTRISIAENPDGSPRTNGSAGGNPDALIEQHLADKQAFADKWVRVDAEHAGRGVPEGSYVPAETDLSKVKAGYYQAKPGQNLLTGQQFDDKIEQFRTNLNAKPAMQKARVTIDRNGNVTRGGQSQQTAQVQQPSQIQPQATAFTGKKVSIAQAMQLPINRGKTADQVKADIQAHGHTAVP